MVTWRIIPFSIWIVTTIYKPPQLEDLLTMVAIYLLTGMILQVPHLCQSKRQPLPTHSQDSILGSWESWGRIRNWHKFFHGEVHGFCVRFSANDRDSCMNQAANTVMVCKSYIDVFRKRQLVFFSLQVTLLTLLLGKFAWATLLPEHGPRPNGAP